ncbi:MAG: hypothetical protein LC114_03345 [Bryobacterales bacterium]|nr:hypothetical protein [Bryobacterales bacterium]
MTNEQFETSAETLPPGEEEIRPALTCYEDLASRLSLSLAADDLTEDTVYAGCRDAIAAQTGAVLVRPSDLDLAKNWLARSNVKLCAIIGFPGGSSATAVRIYEARDALRRGAVELALTMNLGKLLSRKFLYLESELLQIAEQCHQAGGRLRTVFEAERIERDHLLIGIRLAKRTGADVLELEFRGGDPSLMARVVRFATHHAKGKVEIAVEAGDLTLDTALALYEAGADRIVTPAAVTLLNAWRSELERRAEEENSRQKEAASDAGPSIASE